MLETSEELSGVPETILITLLPAGDGDAAPGCADQGRESGGAGHALVACSVLEDAWLEAVKAHSPRPILFLAETVFVYFTEAQVKSLVLTLRDHFPGAELIFDGWRPFEVWLGNRYFSFSNSPFAGLMQWGLWRGQEIEGWGAGIHLLDEWGFFDQPEPRLDSYRWMAPLFRCSSRCASSTSSLERQRCEKTLCFQAEIFTMRSRPEPLPSLLPS
jgi:hypothetical protein